MGLMDYSFGSHSEVAFSGKKFRAVLQKKVFLKISQISQESILQAFRPLSKRDSNKGIFLLNLRNF